MWIVEVGIFVNMLGYGAVLPFEIIYLHDGRGFSLGVAGLVVGTLSGAAAAVTPLAGTLIDRVGARTVAAAAGVALAAGYTGLAFAGAPAAAFLAALVAGVGNGGLQPSQSALIAALATPEVRHRAAAVSRVAVNLGIGLGGAIGGLVAAQGLNGFVGLLLANAATSLVYVSLLVAAVGAQVRPRPAAGGYRAVVRDRAFLQLALTNVALIAVGWGVLAWLIAPYADQLGIPSRLIGLLLLANAATVVVAQVPLLRAVEGRSRTGTLAFAAGVWIGACLLVVAAGRLGEDAGYALLVATAVLIGLGECLYATAFSPLVADLAPVSLRGRYMAASSLSWWLGLALAPTLGARLLADSATLALSAAAGLCLAAIASLLVLDAHLPEAVRLTPRP